MHRRTDSFRFSCIKNMIDSLETGFLGYWGWHIDGSRICGHLPVCSAADAASTSFVGYIVYSIADFLPRNVQSETTATASEPCLRPLGQHFYACCPRNRLCKAERCSLVINEHQHHTQDAGCDSQVFCCQALTEQSTSKHSVSKFRPLVGRSRAGQRSRLRSRNSARLRTCHA